MKLKSTDYRPDIGPPRLSAQTGADSRAIGLELDERTAREARVRLAARQAVGNGRTFPDGAQASVVVADALAPDAAMLGVEPDPATRFECRRTGAR